MDNFWLLAGPYRSEINDIVPNLLYINSCLAWEVQDIYYVKISSYSVQPLPRYYKTQAGSKEDMGNLNLGNPSNLMT